VADRGKRHGCRRHFIAPVARAAAAVDHQAYGCGKIFTREELNRLRLTVVIDGEVLGTQTCDVGALSIDDGDD
jgi:hypothetical protein